jgi:hypothetical protein
MHLAFRRKLPPDQIQRSPSYLSAICDEISTQHITFWAILANF